MHSQTVVPGVVVAARPVHPFILAAPAICFLGALLTDCAYAASANIMWSDFSDWLLAVGMIFGVIALVIAAGNILAHRELRATAHMWASMLGGLVILAVAFLNNLVHSRDAWTSVVPLGLTLSVLTVVLIAMTGWLAGRGRRRGPTLQPVEIR